MNNPGGENIWRIYTRVLRTPGIRPLLILVLAWSGLVPPAVAQNLPAYGAQRRIAAAVRTAAQIAGQSRIPTADTVMARALQIHADGTIGVYIYVDRLTPTVLQTLRQHGVQIHRRHARFGMVYASVAAEDLETVAALPFVRWIRSPLPGTLRTGSVTSLGDTVLGAAEARTTFNVDGSGVRVGIISDSLINLQSSVASGDLPPDLIILDNGSSFPSDEGRAVAEIVHDLAPGATLLFHSGFPTGSDMVQAVQALVAAGADIIVDDIGFFDEPVFEDGMVARAVRDAVDRGVVYVTAAGNDADRHYRGEYVDSDAGDPDANLHDFGGGDTTLDVHLNRQDTMIAVLQWPDPFDGSDNTADYDLLVFDDSGSVDVCAPPGISGVFCIRKGTEDQTNTSAPPLETVMVSNNSAAPVSLTLRVNRVSGADRLLDIHLSREAILLEPQHMVAATSIFGHPCVDGALAVGAINVNDAGFDAIEAFSSQGPCEIVFPAPETRAKPDLVAADGVLTSLPRFSPFLGTSAAAPHVAAIAALVMQAAGGPGGLGNTEIVDLLRQTAVDLGAPGVDQISGAGAVDAVAAIASLPPGLPAPGKPRQDGAGGGGGCSILPAALSPAFPLWEALGNIFLPLVVIVAIRFWRRYRPRH